jgi:multiple sugar transport system ATP-binding protein
MPDIALRLDGISRHYGKVKAVDNLSIDIPSGAFVTLLGPSGCGKSTTLNLVAGLDRLDEGRILLGNDDITFTPPNERRMAMVFQNYALYPHLNAFDNIAFGLKLQHRPAAEIKSRVNAVAEALDITHLLKRKPGQMSGGQQQRVALGRALVKEPLVFLLDEPFSNLDAGLRSRMRTEVKHLHLTLGTTSVFVTHDQEEAMTLSDLIAVMRDGKVVQLGTTREIYRNPRDLYVATFVGKPKMSLVDGLLERSNGELTFVSADLRIALGSPAALGLRDGEWRNVALGIRAEDVTVRHSGSGESPVGTFGATVQLLEPIGSDTFVELASGDATVVARVAPDFHLEIGQSVQATLAPGRVHLFDREGGQRIIH